MGVVGRNELGEIRVVLLVRDNHIHVVEHGAHVRVCHALGLPLKGRHCCCLGLQQGGILGAAMLQVFAHKRLQHDIYFTALHKNSMESP